MDELEELLEEIHRHKAATEAARNGATGEPVGYEKFLDTILSGNHPEFSELIWDGENFSIEFTVQMQRKPGEDVKIIRQRAWRYFRRYGLAERKIVHFRLVIKHDAPSHAVVSVRPEAVALLRLGTARLRELKKS